MIKVNMEHDFCIMYIITIKLNDVKMYYIKWNTFSTYTMYVI